MDAVEDIKQRLGIEEVIGEYVELKRSGRNWKGLSPFSSERTPSFMVSPEKQIWHDFSSGKGGNMFSFVMEMEGLDFRGALELLARKAGIDLSQYRSSQSSDSHRDKEKLYEILEWATKFYQTQLKHNNSALKYVIEKRAFSKATVLEWRLGYSPQSGRALLSFLKGKGFSDYQLKQAGLTSQRYDGLGDMFRGRLMIPLADPQGRIIGFTARLLVDDPKAPKYINTPQTILYDKSNHVFGLHLAKESIRKQKFVVIAEGNLDVISSHQAGVEQVVATAGTALTLQQLKTLGRFTGDIRLCFDADAAGVSATERAVPIANAAEVSLSILDIPSGKDPDELIRQDKKLWQDLVGRPKYAVDWLVEHYQKAFDITSAQGKKAFSDKMIETLRGLHDEVEREHYIGLLAELLGVSRKALADKLSGKVEIKPRLKKKKTDIVLPPKDILDYIKTQNHILALALMQPSLRPNLSGLSADMFTEGQARQLFEFLTAHPEFTGKPTEVDELQSLTDYVKMLALHYEMLYQDIELRELQYEAELRRTKLISQYVKIQKQLLLHQYDDLGDAADTKLLSKVKELDALLKPHRGDM